jgi:hypothetical protein
MSNDLDLAQVDIYSQKIKTLEYMAHIARASGKYKESKEGLLMIMLTAMSYGLNPIQALNNGLYLFNGNVELPAHTIGMLIRQGGHHFEALDMSDKKCVLKGTRQDNGGTWTETYTIEDARGAGLANKDNWKKHPKDMLYARCLSRLGKHLFSDAIKNAYVEGEIRETIVMKKDEIQELDEAKKIEDTNRVNSMVEDFLSSFGEDRDLAERYFGETMVYHKWTQEQTLEKLQKDPTVTNLKFHEWKQKMLSHQDA